MLDVLRGIKEYDTIFFVPHPEDDEQVKIEVAQYKTTSEKVPGSEMGDRSEEHTSELQSH